MKKSFVLIVALLVSTLSSFAQFTYYSSVGSSNSLSSISIDSDILSNIGSSLGYSSTFSSINTDVIYQKGYTRSNGTYVKGHYKTRRNDTNWDNFSTRGNINLYTGTIGSVARDYSSEAYNYGSGRTIYTGPRGGQYYINSNGNKTYVPKRSTNYSW